MTTHSLDQLRDNAFRIDYGFIGCHIQMQIVLVDAPERPEVRAKRRAGPFTGIAVHFTSAISIIIPCPLVHAVADGAMARMAAPIALPLIGIEPCAARRNVLCD